MINRIQSRFFMGLSLALAAPLAGCGGAEGSAMFEEDMGELEDTDDADGYEDVATAVSALCSDSGIADDSGPLTAPPHPVPMSYAMQSTSPDASYGSAACSGRYVVEATGVSPLFVGWNLTASAAWADTSGLTNQTLCESASASLIVYVEIQSIPGLWLYYGEYSDTGTWDSSTNTCVVSEKVDIDVDYVTKVRVAAKASIPFLGGPLPVRVRTVVRKANFELEPG
jgi:hypothetical protein